MRRDGCHSWSRSFAHVPLLPSHRGWLLTPVDEDGINSVEVVEPLRITVVLAAHRRKEHFLQLLRDWPRLACSNRSVIDGGDRNHLSRSTCQERLVRDVQVRSAHQLLAYIEAAVPGDLFH